ncbi:acyl-CoA thioesterase [Agaribacter flavus]|uniref:Acyl-CoA thioesterase n=1 Tax=Agaribacter flavus TaxID=1902781 RepID=A0ABV7FQ85_9ALTE
MKDIKLTSLFDLETIELGLYRGNSWDLGFRALYGGQVLGQSVIAAYKTVPEDRVLHSFHSYFLLPGEATLPVVYDVENVRDGRSFSARRIKAIQNGRVIFYMTASFQLPDECELSHQLAEMPETPPADTLPNDIDLFIASNANMPVHLRKRLDYHRAIDIRTVDAAKSLSGSKQTPLRKIWLKAREALAQDNIALHQASLAYASDYHFLSTALQAHGISPMDKKLRIATIDHAMWFHRPFSFNDWKLYSLKSPSSGNSRALVQGKVFDSNGDLLASSSQEGLIRIKSDE